jgi:hypothetical protein
MSETESENETPIICLNYCMTDPATGYCLTCGRPPIPVSEISLKSGTFNGMSFTVALRSMQMTERALVAASEVAEDGAAQVPSSC